MKRMCYSYRYEKTKKANDRKNKKENKNQIGQAGGASLLDDPLHRSFDWDGWAFDFESAFAGCGERGSIHDVPGKAGASFAGDGGRKDTGNGNGDQGSFPI